LTSEVILLKRLVVVVNKDNVLVKECFSAEEFGGDLTVENVEGHLLIRTVDGQVVAIFREWLYWREIRRKDQVRLLC